MKHTQFKLAVIIGLLCFISCTENKDRYLIDLSGEWQVAVDSLDKGISEKWYEQSFDNFITLPGTLCEAGYGTPCSLQPTMEKEIFLNLKRRFDYVGPAWYSREITVPADWEGKDIILTLERVIWDSQVWIDGVKVNGFNESLIAPHYFNLAPYLSSGKHKISIRIDNRKKYDISMERNLAHAYTNETQTMWNGILGEISLKAKDKVRIDNVAVYPDTDHKKISVTISVINTDGVAPSGKLSFYVEDSKGKKLKTVTQEYQSGETNFEYEIENPELWSEFNPKLYKAVAELSSDSQTTPFITTFGMRKLTNKDALLQINDNRLFLRGTLECCIFPLTGYPPVTIEEWEKVWNAARDYGLNHIRFHSWCPPKAAFEAADKQGIYLQVELPVWILDIGRDKQVENFLYDEAERIIKEYGNHPSFCFWSLGNELQGDFSILDTLMSSLKKKDPRHLYTTTTFTFEKGHGAWPEPNDDFWISQWTNKGWVRGQGSFDDRPANFDKDYTSAIEGLPVPIVTHEIGQYSVYPNLKEIEKYTGNLIPLNFMAVRDDLQRKGRLNKADDYLLASGKLAVILYKEEIERALKTNGVSGFQLLDLHDFPGQGSALVGLLDAFWDSKGLISAEDFRKFNSPVVPLVRFDKATYTNSESFNAQAEIANFTDKTLPAITPVWKLSNSKEEILADGKLNTQDVPVGNTFKLGTITAALSPVTKADKLTLTLAIENTGYTNSWDIWVYPTTVDMNPGNVVYTRSFDEAKKLLSQGKDVLLNPATDEVKGLDGKFVQVFWSPVHFPNQPGTMGILCDPEHPALAEFPTEMHSNWQWWDICKHAKTMELDSLDNIEPIVTMVDNFFKNRNLGLIFETKTELGDGKLLICSSDLNDKLENRPVARQLKYSLLKYMNSNGFNPQKTTSFEQLEKNLRNRDKTKKEKKSIYD